MQRGVVYHAVFRDTGGARLRNFPSSEGGGGFFNEQWGCVNDASGACLFTPRLSLNSSVLSFTTNYKHVFASVKPSKLSENVSCE